MRLIDVDVIVNTLNDGLKKNVEYFKDKQKKPEDIAIEVMAKLVLESIKQQPTVEIPQWIPCSERLPENH